MPGWLAAVTVDLVQDKNRQKVRRQPHVLILTTVLTTVGMELVHCILGFLVFLRKFLCPIEPQVERAGGIRVLVELWCRRGYCLLPVVPQ